jgi:hypothetical protein
VISVQGIVGSVVVCNPIESQPTEITQPILGQTLRRSVPRQQRARSAWFRQGECLRLIYDQLRDAPRPVATRELAERIMRAKAIPATDDHRRELIQKTVLGSLNRAKETIARVETAGVVSWRLI